MKRQLQFPRIPPRWIAGAILCTPLLIILASTLAYYGGYRPDGSTNRGELLLPPQQVADTGWTLGGSAVEALDLQGRWALVVFSPAGCGTQAVQCREAWDAAGRVHQRLHKERPRVHRYLLLPEGGDARSVLLGDSPDAFVLRGGSDFLARELAPDGVYSLTIDPLGNIVMLHQAGQFGRDLFDDLIKLLRLSQIG
ncbi:MAG: hypothetical protein ISN29_01825 [Gammaproteobacteria bacterium AqS3]|nr:hypothetical protein [Gammaproteobacteria bacterium AqS3]